MRDHEEALLIHLDGVGLPEQIYTEYDLITLEDRLIETIDGQELGEYDGSESAPEETVLYLYAPDAEKLFASVEPILRAYPLCEGARVIIRAGGPGAPERQIPRAISR